MSNEITIFFDNPKSFELSNIKPLNGVAGLYFIFSQSIDIQYPFDKSKLLYIGMSERKTNSISSRLSGHFDGKSKNIGLTNYRKIEPLLFTYINFEMLRSMLFTHLGKDFPKPFGVKIRQFYTIKEEQNFEKLDPIKVQQ